MKWPPHSIAKHTNEPNKKQTQNYQRLEVPDYGETQKCSMFMRTCYPPSISPLPKPIAGVE